jgi:PadR family transcriptional regulator, regulatory protein PadR
MTPPPILKGTLDLLALRALSWTPMHGFEIMTALERAAGAPLGIDDSALYQSLYRLEAKGLLETEWGMTEHNRRARYYTLTTAGKSYLRSETKNWMQYAKTVTTILTATPSVARAGA